jgi:NTE family protein
MHGLVLEGGGSRGSYQIGACKALKESGIEVGCVAGTSVGALNGAMIVQNDLEKAYEMWYDINPSKIINFSPRELTGSGRTNPENSMGTVFRSIKKVIAEKGLDIQPLINMLKTVIDEEKIRKSDIEFGIVTVDLTGKKAVEIFKADIPRGRMLDYLIASASFPGFRPTTIDGRLYIDGGFYNSLPVNLVSGKGYNDIILIRTYAVGFIKKVDTTSLSTINIAPSENLGAILDFDTKRIRKNLKMGYYDALRTLNGYKGKKYYIRPLNDDNFFISYLASLSEEKVNRLSYLFGIEKSSGKRTLFEYIIPRVSDLLGLSRNASYEDISVALVEYMAEISGLERFKIYDLKDLLSQISIAYTPVKDDFLKEIPGFLRGNELLSKIVRDKIIGSIASELIKGMGTHPLSLFP